MPYKHIRQLIPPIYDKRIKLTEVQREEIRELYGTISQRKLADMYGVSRRLITFIGDPDKQEENLARRKERGGSSIYYDTERRAKEMKRHRDHKQDLSKKGKLVDKSQHL